MESHSECKNKEDKKAERVQPKSETICDLDGVPFEIFIEEASIQEEYDPPSTSNYGPTDTSGDQKPILQDQRDLRHKRIKEWPNIKEKYMHIKEFQDYQKVKETGLPNADQTKITRETTLNLPLWESLQTGHSDDTIVLNGLRYGFSLNYLGDRLQEKEVEHHPSAANHLAHVDQYFLEECEAGAILGPFDDPPFREWFNTSPVMTRKKSTPPGQTPKKVKRRTIIDLSYPEGENVNSFVTKNNYNGQYISHTLPKVSDIVEDIFKKDFKVVIGSIDISRAYRNFPGDLLDLCLTGIKHRGKYYVDLALPFGARTSACYMQKISEFLTRALANMGLTVRIYLDDIISIFTHEEDAEEGFRKTIQLLRDLGLPIAMEKLQMPGMSVKYLGIWFHVDRRVLELPKDKIENFIALATWVKAQISVSMKVLQKVIGKIQHLAVCVSPARTFANRLLQDMRESHAKKYVTLSEGALKDLEWFIRYMGRCNGRSMMKQSQPSWQIEADACPTGGGATDFTSYIAYTWPAKITESYHISILEALNCLVALRLFVTKEKYHTVVQLKCDNMPAIQVFTNGGARDPYLGAIVRAVWKVVTKADLSVIYTHCPGITMDIPDSLSRMYINEHYKVIAETYIRELALRRKCVKNYNFDFKDLI